MSEADKLAVDASVAPSRVLLYDAYDQLAQFDRGRVYSSIMLAILKRRPSAVES
jgi:hypothetical protein